MTDYEANAKHVLKTLNDAGYEAYFVGGFVRDTLLNLPTKDIDITTNATPQEVIDLFDRVKETGMKYGTVTVLFNNLAYEVTTFRSDGTYTDNRRPDTIQFSKTLEEDVKRRDFTVNALCMDYDGDIIDLVDGQADLAKGELRMIGDPHKRLKEDALRMLRAIRFVSSHGFHLQQETHGAITSHNALIPTIAIERIMQELDKTFRGQYLNEAINVLLETDVADVLYGIKPGLEYLNRKGKQLNNLSPIEIFTICFILGEDNDIWRFSNRQRRLIDQLILLHEVTKEDQFNTFLVFSYSIEVCDIVNRINVTLGYRDQSQRLKEIDQSMPIKDVCDLKFKGEDIIKLTTLKKHSLIGLIIDDLLEGVLEGRLNNNYQELKDYTLNKINALQKDTGDKNE
ncbi:MAG: CCA tRNA nucleotidyltransferase [Candidatus Izemoplasma sp.]|nr:CCA tRNA nucleotidyltransferase [Candidatus Izemoplasma sp.]